jgi:hypothetical protein
MTRWKNQPGSTFGNAAVGRGRHSRAPGADTDGIQRQGAKPPRRNRISFYYETRKPGIIEKISWFPGFLMELFWVAPLRLGGFALKVFCLTADCKV